MVSSPPAGATVSVPPAAAMNDGRRGRRRGTVRELGADGGRDKDARGTDGWWTDGGPHAATVYYDCAQVARPHHHRRRKRGEAVRTRERENRGTRREDE
ncbi:desmoglein-2 [Sesbania bispinosa]|nr:desmoglein-2 [Sesbania bispinosa]